MNFHDLPQAFSMQAEQSILGALINSNVALDKISDLTAEDFYNIDHRKIYTEIVAQISAGKQCDVISLSDALQGQIDDAIVYAHRLSASSPSAASIRVHADLVIDYAKRRNLVAACREVEALVGTTPALELADKLASKLDYISATSNIEPEQFSDSLSNYVELLQSRMDGTIKPIATGFADLDKRLDGGLERGTLTVLAARPGMGKTAFGLAIARNVAEWGSSGFLSMEMPKAQVNDRNVAAIGKVSISWLRKPDEKDQQTWDRVTHAFQKAQSLNLWIDDQTSLNLLAIRSKARFIKRRAGLDLLVIDQLSFITGSKAENKAYELGDYTRGLLALAKELDCAIVLLAQLNRECEKRMNKRPMLSDLSSSGSIEQDASTVIFLYRDEVYNLDTQDKGICEVITAKQRQGEIGTCALTYIGNQTRFEDLAFHWKPAEIKDKPMPRGFD